MSSAQQLRNIGHDPGAFQLSALSSMACWLFVLVLYPHAWESIAAPRPHWVRETYCCVDVGEGEPLSSGRPPPFLPPRSPRPRPRVRAFPERWRRATCVWGARHAAHARSCGHPGGRGGRAAQRAAGLGSRRPFSSLSLPPQSPTAFVDLGDENHIL